MAAGTDYIKLYGKANAAYCQGRLDEALEMTTQIISEYPDDGNTLLLRGHIYLKQAQYTQAQEQYETVLRYNEQPELVNYAYQGLEQIKLAQYQAMDAEYANAETEGLAISEPAFDPTQEFNDDDDDNFNWASHSQNDSLAWDSGVFNEFSEEDLGEPTVGQPQPYTNPFQNDSSKTFKVGSSSASQFQNHPFETNHASSKSGVSWQDLPDAPDDEFPFFEDETDENSHPHLNGMAQTGESTFVVSSDLRSSAQGSSSMGVGSTLLHSHEFDADTPSSNLSNDAHSFDEYTDFGDDSDISQLDITDIAKAIPESAFYTHTGEQDSGEQLRASSEGIPSSQTVSQLTWSEFHGPRESPPIVMSEQRLFRPKAEVSLGLFAPLKNAKIATKQLIISTAAGVAPVLVIFLVSSIAWLSAPKEKVTPPTKSKTKTEKVVPAQKPTSKTAAISPFSPPILWMMLFSGLSGFGVTWLLGQIAILQVNRTLDELQKQFDAISEGNFNVKATIYSEDEFGQLANRFNHIARVVLTTTTDAQRRAAETEQAKEDLHRQVIRLLDDVEGAARGDLMVEAEVTADVLGAVADAFNLTIQNLREIVRQVKKAAVQVNQGSIDSESFARNQSSDALRMAEELAVTLNSVQMMTESIQRVAENAREAEEVARISSISALKGGESVERTVAGILQIRETVSETARKVKRLAEASQEISKIVALISQIASRTNLLALNASIQAARAGEAGKGFAIVADEVRQLADRSAKSLKEIEQIVLQIQSETGSVMTAMEEGIQQVIDVTERSEQAKKSLEDIIQVSNRIDSLVRSITADTVKQRENSHEVAQVMQSVELTAQETSQESQRVGGSLQKLVSISRDLLTSVERFRVDHED
ncbi:chemotaxis protein [Aphanothece hegewaldii CCALA 016]|uniref:Chemotaxis protein n=1 Tax=Aphanothece hegewaldii CCALA 016 TaxID=2107694 RepID=A0A2T1LVV5_9CHRO|nr:HAMP domain-containing methyl-accepting chemotaxis protein [Aphanothece hegewaldii]PSF35984.1 chemotaxis protein [Aphanothece hegewaldii CCALA 016]